MTVAVQREPAPVAWLRRVIEDHGVQVGPDRWQVALSQQHLPEEEGCSSGTIQARIRTLEGFGLVVARRPLIATLAAASPGQGSRTREGGQVVAFPKPEAHHRALSGPSESLLAANAFLAQALEAGAGPGVLEAQRLIVEELREFIAARESEPANPRPEAANPRTPVSYLPTEGREGDFDLQDYTHSSLPPSLKAANVAANPRRESRLDDEVLLGLVSPLQETARRCGLVGLTDSRGLKDALAPFSEAQIRHAVSLAGRLAQAGEIRSPLGWLIAKARDRDADYFPPPSKLSENGTVRPPPAPADPDAHVLDLAENRVTSLEQQPHVGANAALLSRLDALAEERAALATSLNRKLAGRLDPHAARVLAWKELAGRGEVR